MRASAPICCVRRMGTSAIVRMESPRLPKCAYVSLLRHVILLFSERPFQCRYFGRFGHVSVVCKFPLLCLRCAGSHSQDKCDAPTPHCIICGKPHEATSFVCPKTQQERSPCRFPAAHNVSLVEARVAVTTRDGSASITKRSTHLPVSSAKAFTRTTREPSSAASNSCLSPCTQAHDDLMDKGLPGPALQDQDSNPVTSASSPRTK